MEIILFLFALIMLGLCVGVLWLIYLVSQSVIVTLAFAFGLYVLYRVGSSDLSPRRAMDRTELNAFQRGLAEDD